LALGLRLLGRLFGLPAGLRGPQALRPGFAPFATGVVRGRPAGGALLWRRVFKLPSRTPASWKLAAHPGPYQRPAGRRRSESRRGERGTASGTFSIVFAEPWAFGCLRSEPTLISFCLAVPGATRSGAARPRQAWHSVLSTQTSGGGPLRRTRRHRCRQLSAPLSCLPA
jgi:hypothetical protein